MNMHLSITRLMCKVGVSQILSLNSGACILQNSPHALVQVVLKFLEVVKNMNSIVIQFVL